MQSLLVVGRRPVHKVRGQGSAFCQQIHSGWSQSCKTYFPSGETLEGHDTPYECLDHSYVTQSIWQNGDRGKFGFRMSLLQILAAFGVIMHLG